MRKNRRKKGFIDISALNQPPEPHEHKTAKFFSQRGLSVTFIKPSNIKGVRSPDFEMVGRSWEVKGPITYSDRSFEDNFKKAKKQSKHVIYGLRRLSKKNEIIYMKELYKWKDIPELKTLLVITGDGKLLTLKGEFDIM